jgi:dihydrofolate reductase
MARLTVIAAAAEDNSIGKDNALLWHLPDDFRRFKRLTTGHPIIMGRKTFETFPKPLPHRDHIIITRDKSYSVTHPRCTVVHGLTDALRLVDGEDLVYIIGGGEIYAQAMEYADAIELTRVHATFDADTFFPEMDRGQWILVREEYHKEDADHEHAFTYRTFERKDVKAQNRFGRKGRLK